jgi:hypothetical protein
MSTADIHFREAVAGLSRRIAEAEMRSTVAADALAAVTRDGADTVEAERRFNEEMDALLALRQQLAEFLLLKRE